MRPISLLVAMAVATGAGRVEAPGTTRGERPLVTAVGVGGAPAPEAFRWGRARDAPAAPARAVREADLEPARAGVAIPAGLPYRPERIGFGLRVDDVEIGHRVMAVSVLPGRTLAIRVEGAGEGRAALLRHASGSVEPGSSGAWRWTAPDRPGIHGLRVVLEEPADSAWLNVLVLRPRSEIRNGVLGGYRIGSYPPRPLRGDPAYERPRGFVELTPDLSDVLVSPHFTLGQFACKQPGNPKYLVVTGSILVKLEAVLEEVNRSGRATPSLVVMSGYRTPAYNRAIGNRTSYSRHLYGDAADVFVDTDGDGWMDDWNGDGRSDFRDARILRGLMERVVREGKGRILRGGLAVYRRNPVHGPFVHVDARGYPARW